MSVGPVITTEIAKRIIAANDVNSLSTVTLFDVDGSQYTIAGAPNLCIRLDLCHDGIQTIEKIGILLHNIAVLRGITYDPATLAALKTQYQDLKNFTTFTLASDITIDIVNSCCCETDVTVNHTSKDTDDLKEALEKYLSLIFTSLLLIGLFLLAGLLHLICPKVCCPVKKTCCRH